MDAYFDVVVAADDDRGIARGGEIPWRLRGDMAHFRRLTMGMDETAETPASNALNAVVMGRVTWDSLPARFQPLPGRRNVVLSRRPALALPAGVMHAVSLDDALVRLDRDAAVDRVFVIGGAAVYAEAVRMPACRRIYYTRVAGHFGCDLRFPAFEDAYELASVLEEAQEGGVAYRIEVWRRSA